MSRIGSVVVSYGKAIAAPLLVLVGRGVQLGTPKKVYLEALVALLALSTISCLKALGHKGVGLRGLQ